MAMVRPRRRDHGTGREGPRRALLRPHVRAHSSIIVFFSFSHFSSAARFFFCSGRDRWPVGRPPLFSPTPRVRRAPPRPLSLPPFCRRAVTDAVREARRETARGRRRVVRGGGGAHVEAWLLRHMVVFVFEICLKAFRCHDDDDYPQ